MKIGVFDSGIGGLSVARAIEKALPEHEIIFMHDTADHFPYATKTPGEILGYVVPVVQQLVDQGCTIVVIACNTVSTTLIRELREQFAVPLIATEPMVKPAAEATKTGVIAVCATPTTLKSARYHELKELYAEQIKVIEPDCSDWSYMIEQKAVDEQKIKARIEEALAQKADVIVLGCTHYHWIEQLIKRLAGNKAKVIQPEQAIVARLKTVMSEVKA